MGRLKPPVPETWNSKPETLPAPAMPENGLPPPIEEASLINLRTIGGDDDAFVAEIVQMFREDTPPHFAELGDCVAKGDAFRLGKVAHSMKGSSGNFGAKHFRHLTEALEAIAKSGNLAPAPAAIATLHAEYERVLAALDAYIKPAG